MLGIWDYIENKIEVKASVNAHPPHWPFWEPENIPPGGTSKRPDPSTLGAEVPVAVLLGLEGRGQAGGESSWQRDSLKILLKILQDLRSFFESVGKALKCVLKQMIPLLNGPVVRELGKLVSAEYPAALLPVKGSGLVGGDERPRKPGCRWEFCTCRTRTMSTVHSFLTHLLPHIHAVASLGHVQT